MKHGKWYRFFKTLGPGLITGAADDDPSGIATYSQAGAQFGYGQLWTLVATLPFMVAVQEASARIGQVTGKGIAAVIKERYGRVAAAWVVLLVLAANTINIGADIGAMAAATRLLIPISTAVLVLAFAALILALEIFTSYRLYRRILKWLAVFLFSYVFTVVLVTHDWAPLLRATVLPHVEWSFAFLFVAVGVIGTTISPYLFFWEANEEVEDEKEKHLMQKGGVPKVTWRRIRSMRLDNLAGMLFSNIIAWCIMATAAQVLYLRGAGKIASAADAAKALEPLVSAFPNAGFAAKALFALGVVGIGLLAVPVLSGSASYAVAEVLNWRASLSYKLKRAHGFYGAITISTLLGLGINFIGINPIQALVVTAVLNGIVAVPLIFLIGRIAADRKVMGEFKTGWLGNLLIALAFLLMLAAVAAMFLAF